MSIECSTATPPQNTNELDSNHDNNTTVYNREVLQEKVKAVFELPESETLFNGK
jgi:hypothetical protein